VDEERGRRGGTHVDVKGALLVKLNQEDRLLVMRRHLLALLVPTTMPRQLQCEEWEKRMYSLPEVKLWIKSGRDFLSTHISGVMM
jgi:hypothetical protein